MESKLQELTKKIYQEGVEKANNDAKNILDEADAKAKKIIETSEKEAETIVNKAKNDSEQMKKKVITELRLTGEQAVSLLMQKITELLSSSALSGSIKNITSDPGFIKDLIKEIISKWDSSSKNIDLNVILPESSKNKLVDFFTKEAKDILDKGVELKFEDRMDEGFKIGPKDNSFVLSFTEKDFENFFQSFLKPKTKELLFPKE